MKKPYSRNNAAIIISLIITLFACKKTSDSSAVPAPPVTLVTASVAGRITDINNVPISYATVTAGASVATTDINGQFTINNAQLDQDAGLVKVTKEGHFTGARTFLVSSNTTNNVKIQMIPKTVSGTIASSAGGNVDVAGGAKINISAGSFVYAGSNTAYSGQVSVAGYYLNPADTSLVESKPGDMRGVNSANKEGILKSYGILSVEMNDAGGQKLQVAAGKTVTITIPIPLLMQAAAPATVALWYFDETKGLWKEEGTATKLGGSYTGAVTHFSFWSAGQLGQSVKLTATFKDAAGNALKNKLVWVIRPPDETGSGYTNNSGTISGYVPANEVLVLDAFDDCGDLMFKQVIGPFSTDINLGNLTVNESGVPLNITLSGTAVNCTNSPIARGLAKVIISNHGQFSSAISNGVFNIGFSNCINSSNSASLFVYDSLTQLTSNAYDFTISSANQNVGQIRISTCGSAPDSEYIRLTLSGINYSWGPPNLTGAYHSDTANNTLIQASSPGQSVYFYILSGNTSPGNYTITLSAALNGISYPNNGATTTVTEYGLPGGFVIGTASGQMKAQDSTNFQPFSMTYMVRRIL